MANTPVVALRMADRDAEACGRLAASFGLQRSDAIRAFVPSDPSWPDAAAALRLFAPELLDLGREVLSHGVRSILIERLGIAPGELADTNPIEYAAHFAAASSNQLASHVLIRLPDDPRLDPADRGRLALGDRVAGGVSCAAWTNAARRAGCGSDMLEWWSLPAAVHRGPIAGQLVLPVAPATLDEPVGGVAL